MACIWVRLFFTFASMKNKQNKKDFTAESNSVHWAFQRLVKNFVSKENTLNSDCTAHAALFHEKLQIVFANIRV